MATAFYATERQDVTIGGVLSRAFSAIATAPALFFGISFVLVAVPSVVWRMVTLASLPVAVAPGTNPFNQMMPTFVGTLVIWWVLYMAAQAMLFHATQVALEDRPATLGDHAAAMARTLLPLLGLAILLSVSVWVGTLLLVVPGIMLAMMWSVAAPALVLERTGIIGALGRSRALTRDFRWRIFGLVLVIFAIYFLAASVLGLGSFAALGAASRGIYTASPSVYSGIVSLVLQTGIVTIWTAVQGTLYLDLRDRQDGPSGDRLAEVFA